MSHFYNYYITSQILSSRLVLWVLMVCRSLRWRHFWRMLDCNNVAEFGQETEGTGRRDEGVTYLRKCSHG